MCECGFEVECFSQAVTATLLRDRAWNGWRLESVTFRDFGGPVEIPEIVWRRPCGLSTCVYS